MVGFPGTRADQWTIAQHGQRCSVCGSSRVNRTSGRRRGQYAINASGIEVKRLLLDGGPSRNAVLREMLSAFIAKPVVHCSDAELSALGVAHLAGVGAGLWDWEAIRALPRAQQKTTDASDQVSTCRLARERWAHAVEQSRLPAGKCA